MDHGQHAGVSSTRTSVRCDSITEPTEAKALPKIAINAMTAAMATMNVSLPDSLKSFVDDQVVARGYGTASEYVRELIRKDQDRQQLRSLLLEGVASPATEPADDTYFEALRARARRNG